MNECPICGSQRTAARFEVGAGRRLYGCPECGVQFLSPQLSPDELGRLYTESYYRSWGIGGDGENEGAKKMKVATFRPLLELIRRMAGTGAILDVGCATGYFLELALREGYDPYGVEYSGFAASIAAGKIGPGRIFTGVLEDSPFAEASYCAVVMSDLLEHVRDPHATLSKAASLLSTGGVILIMTPDSDAFSNRVMGRRWLHYKPEHFFYFNRRSMEKLAAACGLQLVHFERSKKSLNLDYLHSQLKVYRNWLLTPVSALLNGVLPARMKEKNFRLSIGEMVVVLKKEDH